MCRANEYKPREGFVRYIMQQHDRRAGYGHNEYPQQMLKTKEIDDRIGRDHNIKDIDGKNHNADRFLFHVAELRGGTHHAQGADEGDHNLQK